MKKLSFSFTASLLLLCLLLAFTLQGFPSLGQAGQSQFKVVKVKSIENDPMKYEKLLNDMGTKGWKFSHVISTGGRSFSDLVVFEKK